MPKRIKPIDEQPWGALGVRKILVKNYYIYFIVDDTAMEVKVIAAIYTKMDQAVQLSERNIDVSYFYFSDKIISFIDIYQEIFINKKSFIFNAKTNKECLLNYFLLILLSNNKTFKCTEMKYLDRLIQDFEYFVYMFNLSSLFEIKDFDLQYNLNKLFDTFKKEYIDISEEEAEKKKKQITSKIIETNENKILNIILSYCLVMNYLVTRNKNTGDVEVSISDNYTSFAETRYKP